MKKYDITGMSCAACSARVEKAVSSLEGVSSCSVNLLTNSMVLEGDVESVTVIEAVEKAGYGAREAGNKSAEKKNSTDAEKATKKETDKILIRLCSSAVLLLVLMYISMGHNMLSLPLPSFLAENPMSVGIAQMLLAGLVMVINQRFFINGFKGIVNLSPNMDTLVSLGSLSAFIYSTYVLFLMSSDLTLGNTASAFECLHGLYFESAAMILTLITVGKLLESKAKGKTADALTGLIKLSPKTANIIKDGKEITVNIDSINKGDIFIVRPGEKIATDGTVIEGETSCDESAITGESMPVDKKEGDTVTSATVNLSGTVKVKATRVGEDNTINQIIKMVSDASASKAPIQKLADKVAGVFVPSVLAIALVTLIVWLILGEDLGFAVARGISVLVISCPCSLGLATPVAIMVGNGVGAKKGILFKNATSLEVSGRIKNVVLDKTGTVTEGKPVLTDIIPLGNIRDSELVKIAYSLEKGSEHPLARAIKSYGDDNAIEELEVKHFKAISGSGIEGEINGKMYYAGNMNFISEKVCVGKDTEKKLNALADLGKTPLLFADNTELIGIISVADKIRDDAEKSIKELEAMGMNVILLSGDNKRTAVAVGKRLGVNAVISDVLPDSKEQVIKELKAMGKTAMVGDGINDAPALTTADLGIAIGAGTDIAIDSADVVLMNSDTYDIPSALKLGAATLKNIKENLFWAFFYNCLGIPIAAGAFISLWGWEMNPMLGSLAMSLSSIFVVTNALRLNLKDIRKRVKHQKKKSSAEIIKAVSQITLKNGNITILGGEDEEINISNDNEIINKKETKKMTKTMKIEGMMCPHCEARVKKTLEGLEGVESAVCSHKEGTAVLTLSADVSNDILKSAVEADGYKVLGIE